MRILALIITICFACSCSNEKKTSGSIDVKSANEVELRDSSEIDPLEIAPSEVAINTPYTPPETTPNASSVKTIDVNSTKVPELKNLSEIAADIQYIPLETQPNALLKFIYDITVSGNRFYIKSFNELLCFDKTGKFLYKLAQLGRGPDQYTSITDYDINSGKKQVVVLSDNRLLFYNEIDTGFQFLRNMNLKSPAQYCDFFPNQDDILLSFMASTGENEYQFIGINSGGDTLFMRPNFYKFSRISSALTHIKNDNYIIHHNGTLVVKGLLSDTIFNITNEYKFIPYMILNTHGQGITTDFLANVPPPDKNGTSPDFKFLKINDILEVDRYLLFRHNQTGSTYWGVYDKNLSKSFQFNVRNLLKDDISGGINVEPKFACNGILYSWTDALTFKKFILDNATVTNETLRKPERADELKKMALSINEEDNHILIAITPKR